MSGVTLHEIRRDVVRGGDLWLLMLAGLAAGGGVIFFRVVVLWGWRRRWTGFHPPSPGGQAEMTVLGDYRGRRSGLHHRASLSGSAGHFGRTHRGAACAGAGAGRKKDRDRGGETGGMSFTSGRIAGHVRDGLDDTLAGQPVASEDAGAGGTAADAAVAAGFVLNVVEPHLNGPLGDVPDPRAARRGRRRPS